MRFYRHAPIWFSVLLLILIAGFWPSYFSKIGSGTIHPAHHAHGIAMLLWVLFLIAQPILIQKRRFRWHRTIGRSTFLLAPVIVLSGIWVNVYFMEGREVERRRIDRSVAGHRHVGTKIGSYRPAADYDHGGDGAHLPDSRSRPRL